MTKLRYINIILIILILTACGRGKTGTSGKMTFRQEAASLHDSTQLAWNRMTESDDRKIDGIKRILDEISYTANHDEAELMRLQSLQKTLRQKRYSQELMTSEQIDSYDMATDSLIRGTINLVNSTPEMSSHPITGQLLNEIQEEDNNVIVYRIRYDQKAKEFNDFISRNQNKLTKSGQPYNNFKPLPVFELQTVSQ
jgi:hypothetical protein